MTEYICEVCFILYFNNFSCSKDKNWRGKAHLKKYFKKNLQTVSVIGLLLPSQGLSLTASSSFLSKINMALPIRSKYFVELLVMYSTHTKRQWVAITCNIARYSRERTSEEEIQEGRLKRFTDHTAWNVYNARKLYILWWFNILRITTF